jgi:simple sugar transport system permease protein
VIGTAPGGRFSGAAGSLLAIVAALVTGGVLLAVLGLDPVRAFATLAERFPTEFAVTESLIRMAPLLMVGAGILIAFRGGLFNVGIDGQFLIGAFAVGAIAPGLLGALPHAPGLVLLGILGALAGAAWAILPGALKVRYGLSEIITTIMMNYIAALLTSWLVKGPFKDTSMIPPQTVTIPEALRLPHLPFTRVHAGLLIGVFVVIGVYVFMRGTRLGFKIGVLGASRKAAVHAGLPVGKLTVLVMMISGAFAGLAGANDVLGVKGLFQGEWNPAYGLTGVSLVLLARLNSLAILPLAYFFSYLLFGGELMSRAVRIPVYFIEVLVGLMLIFFAAGEYMERRAAQRRVRV